MARPLKQGIDYFPLDCRFEDDIEMYLIEKGAVGLAVLISLWQMIYSNNGYYIKDNKDLHLLIKKKIDVPIDNIINCIRVCLDRNIFNKSLYEKYKILTSNGIQKRYFNISNKKKEVKVISKYILYDVSSYNNIVNIEINGVNIGGNSINKIKENKIKENKIKRNVDPVKILLKKFNKVLKENKQKYIDKYPDRDHQLQFDLMKNWVENNYTKAKKKSDWNLFIQNWLNKAGPNYGRKSHNVNTEEMEAKTTLKEKIEHFEKEISHLVKVSAPEREINKIKEKLKHLEEKND